MVEESRIILPWYNSNQLVLYDTRHQHKSFYPIYIHVLCQHKTPCSHATYLCEYVTKLCWHAAFKNHAAWKHNYVACWHIRIWHIFSYYIDIIIKILWLCTFVFTVIITCNHFCIILRKYFYDLHTKARKRSWPRTRDQNIQ